MVVKNLPSSTTQAEIQQAQRLLYSGKAYAAAGDPRMQNIINYLSERGFQSASQQVRQRELEAQRIAEQKQQQKSMNTVPYDFVGPLQPGVTREAPPKQISPKKVSYDFVGPLPRGTVREAPPKKELRTVPYDFVGPLQPGVTREAPPKDTTYSFDQPKQTEPSIVKTSGKGQVWEVQPAPTTKQVYKRYVGDKGYIKGTLGFIGGTVSSYFWKGQERSVKKYGGKYDPQFVEQIGGVSEIAPYFTPAGPYILAGSGLESFGTKAGRERIKTQEEELKLSGMSPIFASTVAWGQPSLELGIGALGIKSDISKLISKRDIFKSTTKFLAEEQVISPKVSKVSVISETTIGGKKITGISRQRIFKFGDDYSLGATKGFLIQEPKSSLLFPSGRLKTTAQVSPFKSITLGKSIGPSRTTIPKTPKGALDIFAQTKQGQGVLGKTFGKVYSKPGFSTSFEKVSVGGFRKVGETPFYYFRGGKPSALRIYPERISYVTKPTITGAFWKAPAKETKVFEVWAKPSGNIYKPTAPTKLAKKSAISQVTSLSEAARASTLASVPSTPASLSGVTQTFTKQISSQTIVPKMSFQIVRKEQKPKVTQDIFQPTTTRTRSMIKVLSDIAPAQKARQDFIPTSVSRTVMDLAQDIKLVPAQVTRQAQKTSGARYAPIPIALPTFSSVRPGKGGAFGLPLFLGRAPMGAGVIGASFIPQVMHKGKWKTVGKRMDRNSALSRASEGADLSTSRRMRIVPSSKPAQITGIGGWSSRKYKFREYRKSKGKKVPLTNSYIEKTTYAIDTPSEKRGLNIAKISKNMGWLSGTSNKKSKKKSPWLI